MNRFVRFLCHCSGARRDALRYAPGSRNRVATSGAILLLVGLIASLTGGYAVTRLFYGEPYAVAAAVVFGAVWGCFVFTLDRLLTMTIVKPAPWWKLALQAAARVPFAIVVAWTLSMPVILRVSNTLLERSIRDDLRTSLLKEQAQNGVLENIEAKAANADKTSRDVAAQQARLRAVPDSPDWRQAHDRATAAAAAEVRIRQNNSQRIATATRTLETLPVDSTPEENPTRQSLLNQITRWRAEIARAESASRQAQSAEANAYERWKAKETTRLSGFEQAEEEARQSLTAATRRVDTRNQESEGELTELMSSNLVNQYTTYKRIIDDRTHPASSSLRSWAWALHLLFFLLETVAIVVKIMAPPDALDAAAAALNELDVERVNSRVNGEMLHIQALMSIAEQARQQARDSWQNQIQSNLQANPAAAKQILKDIQRDIDDLAA
jgi:hypothetical protein